MASERDGWELAFISRKEFDVQSFVLVIVGNRRRCIIITNVPREPSATAMATPTEAPCRADPGSLIENQFESQLIVNYFFENEYWNFQIPAFLCQERTPFREGDMEGMSASNRLSLVESEGGGSEIFVPSWSLPREGVFCFIACRNSTEECFRSRTS